VSDRKAVSIDSRRVRSSVVIPQIFTINCISQFLVLDSWFFLPA
jgi:hypothetical protein